MKQFLAWHSSDMDVIPMCGKEMIALASKTYGIERCSKTSISTLAHRLMHPEGIRVSGWVI